MSTPNDEFLAVLEGIDHSLEKIARVLERLETIQMLELLPLVEDHPLEDVGKVLRDFLDQIKPAVKKWTDEV